MEMAVLFFPQTCFRKYRSNKPLDSFTIRPQLTGHCCLLFISIQINRFLVLTRVFTRTVSVLIER